MAARFAIQGKDEARKNAMASLVALEKRFTSNVEALVHEVDIYIKSLTPVNTGQAVRNYIWTRDLPNTTVFEAIDNGDPGPTNSMPLGVEPRRGVNETAAAESIGSLGVTANPFGAFILTNVSPDIAGLELGLLPGPPLRSRSPNGMFALTDAFFKAKLASKGMLS